MFAWHHQWGAAAVPAAHHCSVTRHVLCVFNPACCLQRVNEWWTGVFYGNVPEIDRCGHGFVHHRNEMENDDWGNSHLDRASLFHFCQWVSEANIITRQHDDTMVFWQLGSLHCQVPQAAAHRRVHECGWRVTSQAAEQRRLGTTCYTAIWDNNLLSHFISGGEGLQSANHRSYNMSAAVGRAGCDSRAVAQHRPGPAARLPQLRLLWATAADCHRHGLLLQLRCCSAGAGWPAAVCAAVCVAFCC
jgi:hypothetical protein